MHRARSPVFDHRLFECLEGWEARLDAAVAEFEPRLVAVRRHLHSHPEPSGEEFETTQFLEAQLRTAGLSPRICRRGVGVIADLELGVQRPETPTIALRADIDALRIPDQKQVEYRSRHEGVAHACGHDAHAAIVLGAALAGAASVTWKPPTEDWGCRLRFLFQPAEETSHGATWMVEDGGLEGVDLILGIHVDPEQPAGRVGIRYGALTANCDEIEIVIDGYGGHAARPHHAADPIAAAAQLLSACYQSLPRAIDSRNPSVFTVGQIAGGYAPNVIPESVTLRGSLRTTDAPSRERIMRKLTEIAQGIERLSETRIRVTYRNPLGAVYNDPIAAAALEHAARRIVPPEDVILIDRASMGGEDFAIYLERVPGAMLRLGCAPNDGPRPFLHSPIFDLDERALSLGTRILLRAALLLAMRLRPTEAAT